MDEKLKKLMSDGWSWRSSGVNYTPTDADLEKIAGMINSGIAQGGILITDNGTGETYDIYVDNSKLMMKKVESEA